MPEDKDAEDKDAEEKATDEQVDRVRKLYCDSSDNIQVECGAATAECGDGVWIQGWLWLPDKENCE